MEPAFIAALASISAAFIALGGAIYNRRKTEEVADIARIANKNLSLQLKTIENRQQDNLALFKSDLDQITFAVNVNHSKRVEVLTEAYSKLAEIKLLMESFVVPFFANSVTGNLQTISDSEKKFEDLYKFCSMKSVYFSQDSSLMTALGTLMGCINKMRNFSQSGDWSQQANIVINEVNPLLYQIREEVRAELKFTP